MKKRKIAVFLFISLFLLSGCSVFKKGTTNSSSSSSTTSSSTNASKTSTTSNYSGQLAVVQQTYSAKRTQLEQARLRTHNDSLTAKEQDRVTTESTLISDTNKELAARNTDAINTINNAYNNAIANIGQEILSADEKQSAIQQATNTKAGNLYNQQTAYFSKTTAVNALKREYDTKIQMAKDTRDQNEASFKKDCNAKYDKIFANITVPYGGTGTPWEVSLAAEQKELTDFYTSEDNKYYDKVASLDSWFKDSLKLLFN